MSSFEEGVDQRRCCVPTRFVACFGGKEVAPRPHDDHVERSDEPGYPSWAASLYALWIGSRIAPCTWYAVYWWYLVWF
jgi:hypothetical protein